MRTIELSQGKVTLVDDEDGRELHIGLFDDILDAARAYEEAAAVYHKEFARVQ